MFSKSLAKKALAVSASLALGFGGALALSGSAQAADATATVVTFEADDTLGAAAAAFEGGAGAIADGSNGHAGKVFQFTKSAGGNQWSGMNLVLAENNLRVTTGDLPVVTMDVWSGASVATPVMFKLQSAAGWPGSHTCAKAVEAQPGWNSLSFDMSTAKCTDTDNGWANESYQTGLSYIVAAVFPDFSDDDSTYTGAPNQAKADQVYLIDNVSFNKSVSAAPTVKISGPSKKVLRVTLDNAAGQHATVKIKGVRSWTSSGTFTAGVKTLNFSVPSGSYKVSVTVGSTTVTKTQVVK